MDKLAIASLFIVATPFALSLWLLWTEDFNMKFRLVYYQPDPFTHEAFVLGAMIQADGVRFVRAPTHPSKERLGGGRALSVMNLILESLDACKDFNLKSGAISQLVLVTGAQEMPSTVIAPISWVQEQLKQQIKADALDNQQ